MIRCYATYIVHTEEEEVLCRPTYQCIPLEVPSAIVVVAFHSWLYWAVHYMVLKSN